MADNAFGLEQARVNPIQREAALRQGQIQSNLGRRGLGGSSFLDQALDSSAAEFGQREGDARSLARQELIQGLLGLDQASLGATSQLSGLQNQIAQQRLDQELAALNFGKGQFSKNKSMGFNFGLVPGGPGARGGSN